MSRAELPRRPAALTVALLRRWPLPRLDPDGDKDTRGHVLVVAGATQTPGAALLAGTAALRAGAGRLVLAVPAIVAPLLAMQMPEARVVGLPASADGALAPVAARKLARLVDDASAILCGPGMIDSRTLAHLVATAAGAALPVVLDAAALRSVRRRAARSNIEVPHVVITPHGGEMAELMDAERASIEARPSDFAARFARASGLIVVLKGAASAVAHPDGRMWLHTGGTIGLATSGSGDVLAGIIAGLAARGASVEQAAVWGVALHGLAGKALSTRMGAVGLLARELPAEIPPILRRLARARSLS